MTSDEGRRALDVSLAVTVEPAIEQAELRAAWQEVAPKDVAPHAHAEATPADKRTRITLRATRTHFDSWSAALALEDLLAWLGGSDRKLKLQTDRQERRALELSQLAGANRTRHAAFWSETLKDAPLPLPFVQRGRALAPVGFGLNRGPTARIAALLPPHTASDENTLLVAFARALAEVTGLPDFLIACDIDGRASESARATVGPLAATVPLVCRIDATEPPEALTARIARDLRHAHAHAAFDLAACEETFGAAWRAAGIVPRQIGFSYIGRATNPPALLAMTDTPLHFGRLAVRRDDADLTPIENELRLGITPAGDGHRAEIAYDRDVVSAEFAQALLDALVHELRDTRQKTSVPQELSAQTPR